MSDIGETILEVRGLTKIFPGVIALSDVEFCVKEGEVHAICGENGAGKSTLIKVLTGVQQKDSGEYRLYGKTADIRNTQGAIDAGIACVYQELSVVNQLDVAKNIFIGNIPIKPKAGILDKDRLYREAQDILSTLGLDISPRERVGSLSAAQQQMIEICRALARKARIIILDEPTSSLTSKEIEILLNLIKNLRQQKVSIIYITHKLEEIFEIADRVTVMRDGKVITVENTERITKDGLMSCMIGRSIKNYYQKKKLDMGHTVLKVNNLTRNGVFDNVSFEVRQGEVLGFFGLVGAGRSEIMRAIFGIDKYDSGKIFIDGKPTNITSPLNAVKHGMGFIPENRKREGLFLGLSVMLNMSIVKINELSRMGIINKQARVQLVKDYIESLNIKTPSLEQLALNLSGGNQQKIVIAKWLMMNLKILILDEPTKGVDVGSKSEIYGLINKLASKGVAIIVISSEIPEILGICDRIITMWEGKQTSCIENEKLNSHTLLAAALGNNI